jgi:hypothetical protein
VEHPVSAGDQRGDPPVIVLGIWSFSFADSTYSAGKSNWDYDCRCSASTFPNIGLSGTGLRAILPTATTL